MVFESMRVRRRSGGAGRRVAIVAGLIGMIMLGGCSGLSALNAVAPEGGYQVERDLSYGPQPRQRLDVYRPRGGLAEQPAPRPIIIFWHGGRWSYGEPAQYRFVASQLTRMGYTAVLPAYRLYPAAQWQAFAQDAAAGLEWVCQRATALGGAEDSVFVMGHSAGAWLAAMAALRGTTSCRPAGFIGLAGPYDFLPLEADDLKQMFGPPAQRERTQPVNLVSPDAPPMLLVHGLRDDTVKPVNSRSLAASARAAGVPVTEHYPRWFGHGSLLTSLLPRFGALFGVQAALAQFVATYAPGVSTDAPPGQASAQTRGLEVARDSIVEHRDPGVNQR